MKKVKDMTSKDLKKLIESSQVKTNSIEVSGVSVTSTNESLKSLVETIDNLLTKHKDYLLLKKELKIKTGYNG